MRTTVFVEIRFKNFGQSSRIIGVVAGFLFDYGQWSLIGFVEFSAVQAVSDFENAVQEIRR